MGLCILRALYRHDLQKGQLCGSEEQNHFSTGQINMKEEQKVNYTLAETKFPDCIATGCTTALGRKI